MNRRLALKNLLFLSSGADFVAQHLGNQKSPSILVDRFTIDASQENLLTNRGDTFIPPIDTPGAQGLKLHLFTGMMRNDCHPAKDQGAFVSELEPINPFAVEPPGPAFENCAPSARVELLTMPNSPQVARPESGPLDHLMPSRTSPGYRISVYVRSHFLPHA